MTIVMIYSDTHDAKYFKGSSHSARAGHVTVFVTGPGPVIIIGVASHSSSQLTLDSEGTLLQLQYVTMKWYEPIFSECHFKDIGLGKGKTGLTNINEMIFKNLLNP